MARDSVRRVAALWRARPHPAASSFIRSSIFCFKSTKNKEAMLNSPQLPVCLISSESFMQRAHVLALPPDQGSYVCAPRNAGAPRRYISFT